MRANNPAEMVLVILHFLWNEPSIPAATRQRAIGKMGRRNLGNPDEKKIPRSVTNQMMAETLHSLVFLIARNINGAMANTVGPKKSQKPGLFGCTAAKKRNGSDRAGLCTEDVPVSLARFAIAYAVTRFGENLSYRKGKTGSPVHMRFRRYGQMPPSRAPRPKARAPTADRSSMIRARAIAAATMHSVYFAPAMPPARNPARTACLHVPPFVLCCRTIRVVVARNAI